MKIYFFIIAALVYTTNLQAQTDTTANRNHTVSKVKPAWETSKKGKVAAKSTAHRNHKNSCKMADNTMFVVKDGLTMLMASDMMLKNGIVILTNGVVVANNGKKTQLKNGESINMQGMIYPTEKNQHKTQVAR
jgi:hypothetical protein